PACARRLAPARALEAARPGRPHHRHPGPGATQRSRRVDLARFAPHAACIVEQRERQVAVDPDRVLRAETEVRITEPILQRHAWRTACTVAQRRDGRLVVAAQRPAELTTTPPDPLEREAARAAHDDTRLGVDAQREPDRPRSGLPAADLTHGDVPAPGCRVFLE